MNARRLGRIVAPGHGSMLAIGADGFDKLEPMTGPMEHAFDRKLVDRRSIRRIRARSEADTLMVSRSIFMA